MSIAPMASALRSEAERIDKIVKRTKWYVFGSALSKPEKASDYDVLIQCSDDENAIIVRRELRDLSLSYPLHLMILTDAEEAELQFVEAERCEIFFDGTGQLGIGKSSINSR